MCAALLRFFLFLSWHTHTLICYCCFYYFAYSLRFSLCFSIFLFVLHFVLPFISLQINGIPPWELGRRDIGGILLCIVRLCDRTHVQTTKATRTTSELCFIKIVYNFSFIFWPTKIRIRAFAICVQGRHFNRGGAGELVNLFCGF